MLNTTTIQKVQDYICQLKEDRSGSGLIVFFEEVESDHKSPRKVIHEYYDSYFNNDEDDYTFTVDSMIFVEEVGNWQNTLWGLCDRYDLTDEYDDILSLLDEVVTSGEEVMVWHISSRTSERVTISQDDEDDNEVLEDDEDNLVSTNAFDALFICVDGRFYVLHMGRTR